MINQSRNIKTAQRQMRHATANETVDTHGHTWSEPGHEDIEASSKAVGWSNYGITLPNAPKEKVSNCQLISDISVTHGPVGQIPFPS